LSRIDAELTGITKISYATFRLMCDFVENNLRYTTKLDYENVLVGICQKTDIYIYKLEGLAWCEIDDKSHWQRAVTKIYHKIKVREKGLPPVQRNILLNPGPATTTDSVKYAQVVPDICPREKEFGEIMQFISIELTGFAANSKDYTTG
jgi:2-aminoethylphosphonate-pyruvate transaminase